MAITIHPIETGRVKIKKNQVTKAHNHFPGLFNILFGQEWTSWLPILAFVIEHPDGLVVVDTGETSRTAHSGYLPWHPYYNRAVLFDVKPEDEIGRQMDLMGLDRSQIQLVVLTHLHTDHAGGLADFPQQRILVHPQEFESARGFMGRVQGYLPHRWPAWFAPEMMTFADGPFGPFESSHKLTADGQIVAVPTPGHTAAHFSVVVQDGELTYFLAGDSTYNEANLISETPSGLDLPSAAETHEKIRALAAAGPLIYLPAHDPESVKRLTKKQPVILPPHH